MIWMFSVILSRLWCFNTLETSRYNVPSVGVHLRAQLCVQGANSAVFKNVRSGFILGTNLWFSQSTLVRQSSIFVSEIFHPPSLTCLVLHFYSAGEVFRPPSECPVIVCGIFWVAGHCCPPVWAQSEGRFSSLNDELSTGLSLPWRSFSCSILWRGYTSLSFDKPR